MARQQTFILFRGKRIVNPRSSAPTDQEAEEGLPCQRMSALLRITFLCWIEAEPMGNEHAAAVGLEREPKLKPSSDGARA